jgi:NAD(P)-dependent dehydrogenase (short-subunit alcohol dehydrogenase family)
MNVAGKVALVTGGARRVGRALSLALAEAGADVIVHYNASAGEAQNVAREIEALGGRALALQADVAHGADVRRLVREVESDWGRLDILVNSAATFESAPFLEIGEDEWDRVLAVNLKGPFLLMQSAAPLLRVSGDGVIINIADLSAFQPWPSYAHHAVSKAGLIHLTRIAARALAPSIRVNCIAPGTVLPPEGYTGIGSDGTSDRRLVTPAGTPEDVARALLFLIESSFITGQTIVIDGGRLLL